MTTKTIITTDSGMDPINQSIMIPAEIIENNTTTYKDIEEITPQEILERTQKGNTYKTSSPTPEDYQNKFIPLLEEKYNIIHLTMSSGISEGSLNSALLISNILNENYPNKIYIVDSLNGATGGTLITEIAQSLTNSNKTPKEIISILNQIKKDIQTSFYVPNPEGFIRSGRNKSELCLKEKALLIGSRTATIAGIKFRVDFNQDGNLYTKSLLKCKTSKGMLQLTKNIINQNNKELYDPNYIVIGTLQEEKVNMQELIDYLHNLNYFKKIINQPINGVVAAYGSPDLCGLSLLKKQLNNIPLQEQSNKTCTKKKYTPNLHSLVTVNNSNYH